MRATASERQKAVEIITTTFDQNPSVNIVIGPGGNRARKIGRLAEYAFVKAINREGAYLSSNKKGAALCFLSDSGKFSLREVWFEMRLAMVLPLKRVLQTLKREAYIKKHRFTGRHLYFWFLGVEKDGGQAVYELKEHIFEISRQEKLPILLETSVQRNMEVYERFGFTVYHTWEDSGDGNALWFMKRDWDA